MVIIAAKYGSFSKDRYNLVKNTLLTVPDINSELIIEELTGNGPKFIEKELKNVLVRMNIEKNIFFLNFLTVPKECIIKRLEKPLDDPTIRPELVSYTKNGLSGIVFAKDFINVVTTRSYSFGKLAKLAFVLAFIHSAIPFAYRALTYGVEYTAGDSVAEYILTSVFFLMSNFFFTLNYIFFFFAFYLYKTKSIYFSQLSNLISLRKVESFSTEKIYPTFNIYSVQSYMS